MDTHFGRNSRQELTKRDVIPFIGVYDVFSASITARYYNGIIISGFGFDDVTRFTFRKENL